MSAFCSLPNTAPARQLCQLEPDQIEKVSHSAILCRFSDCSLETGHVLQFPEKALPPVLTFLTAPTRHGDVYI